jgi:hypothetical protein
MRADDVRDGIALVREGAARQRAMGIIWAIPYFFGVAADLAGGEKRFDMLEEALQLATATEVRWFQPELYRIRGNLLARAGDVAATACYWHAVAEAHSQGSPHWELRASLSLAGRLRAIAFALEQTALLGPVFNALKANGDASDLLACRAPAGEARSRCLKSAPPEGWLIGVDDAPTTPDRCDVGSIPSAAERAIQAHARSRSRRKRNSPIR